MVQASGLLSIVMGIGLPLMSGGLLAASRRRDDESRWRDALFVFAALLLGLPLFAAALYIAGSSIEHGQPLQPTEAKIENWLILALVAILVALAARTAWTSFFYSSDGLPWERGALDRIPHLLGFTLGSIVILSMGLVIAGVVIAVADLKADVPLLGIGCAIVLAVPAAWAALCAMSGGNPSPRAFMRSREQQRRVLAALEGAPGSWLSVEVHAIADLEPDLSLKAVVWHADAGGRYWRADDAYALCRYHRWAADHALAPCQALHAQQITAWAGSWPRSMRGLVITPHGRLWRWRVWRAHRNANAPAVGGSAEQAAHLIEISDSRLCAAGLRVTTQSASSARNPPQQVRRWLRAPLNAIRLLASRAL